MYRGFLEGVPIRVYTLAQIIVMIFSSINMSASLMRATVRAVNKRKILATRAALTLTPAAVSKIRLLLQDKPEYIGLKVGVRTRGCNGLTYTLEYTTEREKSDEEVLQDGVRVFIEKKAQLTLLGTEMDFVESKLSNLKTERMPTRKLGVRKSSR
uniref:Iron-sulfur cluster assembly 1 homolog, mitochondrial n=1 Tax=Cyprinodon variegatus TaxID=28743 RepID=A0A3Q2CWV7_CYPVA